jgi:N-acyl-D-aspartate/D-glutamate deacylase
MHDLVIRDGLVIDGSGAPSFHGDVAIDADCIVAVGAGLGAGRREIRAEGRIVTPGWVDVHSHYDGQATWDPEISPSGAHGVTTTVMGNCGVGFAPVRPKDHAWLINLMEGVEDIPGTALSEGMSWDWESFPDYLDVLERMPRVMDVATQIPHAAVRAYVMGVEESVRGIATPEQLQQMQRLVTEGIAAGALGFSTSRTKLHLAKNGSAVPGSFVEYEELLRLCCAVKDGGGGIIQLVTDWSKNPAVEFDWIRRLADESGQTVSFTVVQFDEAPDNFRKLLRWTDEAVSAGSPLRPGVGCRPVGMVISLESTTHPFSEHPSYLSIKDLPLAERVAVMRDVHFRKRLLSEETTSKHRFWRPRMSRFERMFALTSPPSYEPSPQESIAARANASGRSPAELIYDTLLENDGHGWLYFPFISYSDGNFDALHEMMTNQNSVLSLADGGAHCGFISDASTPTFLLTHWVKARDRGPKLTIEQAVHLQTNRTASCFGLEDRGRLAPGRKADVNVIDLDALSIGLPYFASDLPAGGRRLLQDAKGYSYTLASGEITYLDGKATGARPGRVIRGRKTAH